MNKKIVAFIDVLGWRTLVKSAEIDPDQARVVKRALQIMRETPCHNPHHDVYFSVFSDSLLISAAPSAEGLASIILMAENVSTNLISQCDLMIRGGVVVGPLNHDDKGEWGSALEEAYQLCEPTDAPGRIACSDEVARMIKETYRSTHDQLLRKRQSGGKSEHYLNMLWHFQYPDPHNPRAGQLVLDSEATRIAALIQRNLSSHKHQPKILRKWLWYRAAWNRSVMRHGAFPTVPRKPNRSRVD